MRIPWNKGLTKSDPRVMKYSLAKIGKKRPIHVIEALRKAHLGIPRSQETRKKISNFQKGKKWRLGIKGSEKQKEWMRMHMKGKNNPNWKGDKYSENYRERRRIQKIIQNKVFQRDNYTCQMCFNQGGILHVDHIQPFSEYIEGRFDMNNLRTLCRSCHYLVTFNKPMPTNSKWGISFMKREVD